MAKLGPGFKLKDGKVVKDERAIERRLPVNVRLQRRKSNRVRPAKKGEIAKMA